MNVSLHPARPTLVLAVSLLLTSGCDDAGVTRLTVDGGPEAIVAADFDADGQPDLAVAQSSPQGNHHPGAVTIFHNEGGAFARADRYTVGALPEMMASADLDGDGHPDLATANQRESSISVLLSRGDSFADPTPYEVGLGPGYIGIADLDGDGHLDLIVRNDRDRDQHTILANTGDGTFESLGSPVPHVRLPMTMPHERFMLVEDVAFDEHPDLVIAGDRRVQVLLGRGKRDQTIRFHPPREYRVGSGPLAFTDFTGSGQDDLLVLGAGENGRAPGLLRRIDDDRLKSQFRSPFRPEPLLSSDILPEGVISHAVGDWTGDGSLDLVIGTRDYDRQHQLLVLANRGDGTFEVHAQRPVEHTPGGLALADFNGDGKLDLAVAFHVAPGGRSDRVWVYPNASLQP